jgi:hypothetical protein
MVIDSESKEDTARQWASGEYTRGRVAAAEVDFIQVPNDPIPHLTLVTVESRGEGGRAGKVITPEGYLVDLREDVLHEIMFRWGIPVGGRLEGPFRWIKLGTQMRLAHMQTGLYRQVEELDRVGRTPRKSVISNSALQKGGVYSGRPKKAVLYLGRGVANGVRRLIWAELWAYTDTNDFQQAYQSFIQHPNHWLLATTQHSFTTHLGNVKLAPDHRGYEAVDGWGGRLGPVTWEDDNV